MTFIVYLLIHTFLTMMRVSMSMMLNLFFFNYNRNWFFPTENFFNVTTSKNVMRINRLVFKNHFNVIEIIIHKIRKNFERGVSLRFINWFYSNVHSRSKCFNHNNRLIKKLFSFWICEFFKENNLSIWFMIRVFHKWFNSLLYLSNRKYSLSYTRDHFACFA